MELPLVIITKAADLYVAAPLVDAEHADEHEYVVAVPEDLERVPVPVLATLYNLAHPGMHVDSFKPGTIVKYCLPALLKLAEERLKSQQPAAEAETNQGVKPEEERTVEQTQEPKKDAPVKKRDIVVTYKKGSKEAKFKANSLRTKAYEQALKDPKGLDAKLRTIANWLVTNDFLTRS